MSFVKDKLIAYFSMMKLLQKFTRRQIQIYTYILFSFSRSSYSSSLARTGRFTSSPSKFEARKSREKREREGEKIIPTRKRYMENSDEIADTFEPTFAREQLRGMAHAK